jgi:hypothetical protein
VDRARVEFPGGRTKTGILRADGNNAPAADLTVNIDHTSLEICDYRLRLQGMEQIQSVSAPGR